MATKLLNRMYAACRRACCPGHDFHWPRLIDGRLRVTCERCGFVSAGIDVAAERPRHVPKVIRWLRRRVA